MWFYDIRDYILNHLAVWSMKHCYNWATTFYTACSNLTPAEIEAMTKIYLEGIK